MVIKESTALTNLQEGMKYLYGEAISHALGNYLTTT